MGDADSAVREYASWSPERIREDARVPEGERDPWELAAMVLLNTEAGLLPNSGRGFLTDSFGMLDERLSLIDANLEHREPRFRTSYQLVERLIGEAISREDSRLLEFCRTWIVASASKLRRSHFMMSDSGAPLEPDERLTDYAELRLLRGAVQQSWAGPRTPSGPGFVFFVGTKDERTARWVRSPAGEFNADTLRRAEHDLRNALELDPALIEARLRLGHVRMLTNRRRDAEADLALTVADAEAAGEPFLAYLGTLLLGRLDEIGDRPAEALERYRRATTIQPDGTAARIALGQALIAAGRVEDGWTETRRVFGDIGDPRPAARDPWSIYPAAQYWRIDELLGELRAMVSQSPRRVVPDPSNAALVPAPMDDPVRPAASPPRPGRDRPGFRLGVDGVRVDVLVTEDGQPVTGLDAKHFEIRDNDVTQRVEAIGTTNNLHAVLLLDTSSSTGREVWAPLMAAADAVLSALRRGDVVSLVTVSDRIRLRAHRVADPGRLRQILAGVRAEPISKTALWDGVFAAASLVADAPGRPMVFVLSDGGDNASWFERTRALERVARMGISIDAVQVSFSLVRYTWNGDVAFGDLSLRPLVKSTGGMVLDADDEALNAKIAARFAALRSSYVLLYQPTNVRRGDGWHEIEVRLRNGARGRVQARSGYYSPPIR